MSALLFIVVLACTGLVIFWYVRDQSTKGGRAESGILGMQSRLSDDRKSGSKPSWKPSGAKRPWRVGR
jgi:hypothetical protein